MKIIVEANIPYIRGIFEPVAEVEYLKADEITPAAVSDADAIVVRTRTRCNSDLLKGSRCSLVVSATIGLDHVDIPWCESHGIEVINAPGCNAPAVAQYVMGVVAQWMKMRGLTTAEGLKIAVVGVGHVGSIVAEWAQRMGMTPLLVDPPRCRRGNSGIWIDLREAARQTDIITFHTPLNMSGTDCSYHLCDEQLIKLMKPEALIINASRGAVADCAALAAALKSGEIKYVALDVWEGEPDIDVELMNDCFVATPHIAGYSEEGKRRATDMAVNAVIRHFNFDLPLRTIDMGVSRTPTLAEVEASYNPMNDTANFRNAPREMERLRNTYPLRKEV